MWCDSLLVNANNRCTYFNESQDSQSTTEYFLASDMRMVSVCEILDLSVNLSDHAPVRVICQCTVANSRGVTDDRPNVGNDTTSVAHLRWDYTFIITPKQQTVDKIIQYNTTQHNHHKSRKELIYTVINQIKSNHINYTDLSLYRECTGYHLQPILTDILHSEKCADISLQKS